jgi:hypothetical protein
MRKQVAVDTASSGGVANSRGVRHVLSLRGLKDSNTSKKRAWSCKRFGINLDN